MGAIAAVLAAVIGLGGAALGAALGAKAAADSARSLAGESFAREKRVALYAEVVSVITDVQKAPTKITGGPQGSVSCTPESLRDQAATLAALDASSVKLTGLLAQVKIVGSEAVLDPVERMSSAADGLVVFLGHIASDKKYSCTWRTRELTDDSTRAAIDGCESVLREYSRRFAEAARADLRIPS